MKTTELNKKNNPGKIARLMLLGLVVMISFSSCVVRERAYGSHYVPGHYAPGYYHEHWVPAHWS